MSSEGASDPFEKTYGIILNHFPQAAFRVEITMGGIWFCNVTGPGGMVVLQWDPKRKKLGVSEIPGNGGLTHQPDIAFDTPEELGGAAVALLWRMEDSKKEGY